MKKECSEREITELVNRAYYLVESRNFSEAKKLLQKALDISDDIPDAHNELGLIYYLSGDYPSAYHHTCRAIELDSTNPKFHNGLACVLMGMNQLDEALTVAYTAIELDPGYASAHSLVSTILKKMGKSDKEASYHKEVARKIYELTGKRSDGTPLRETDLKHFFSDLEKSIENPEPTESFKEKIIKWTIGQIRKDPDSQVENKTDSEAITNPIRPTYLQHYEQVAQSAAGQPCELTLAEVAEQGPYVTLIYRWRDDLTYEEADRLDSRVRAYVTCAIYDAAISTGMSCQPGPSHGQRPSWLIAEQNIPISLVSAEFDNSERVCRLLVGPIMTILKSGMPRGPDPVARKLAQAFQSCFARITA